MSAAEKRWINPFGNGKTAEAIIIVLLRTLWTNKVADPAYNRHKTPKKHCLMS
jgi:hypothetical protein